MLGSGRRPAQDTLVRRARRGEPAGGHSGARAQHPPDAAGARALVRQGTGTPLAPAAAGRGTLALPGVAGRAHSPRVAAHPPPAGPRGAGAVLAAPGAVLQALLAPGRRARGAGRAHRARPGRQRQRAALRGPRLCAAPRGGDAGAQVAGVAGAGRGRGRGRQRGGALLRPPAQRALLRGTAQRARGAGELPAPPARSHPAAPLRAGPRPARAAQRAPGAGGAAAAQAPPAAAAPPPPGRAAARRAPGACPARGRPPGHPPGHPGPSALRLRVVRAAVAARRGVAGERGARERRGDAARGPGQGGGGCLGARRPCPGAPRWVLGKILDEAVVLSHQRVGGQAPNGGLASSVTCSVVDCTFGLLTL